MEEQFVPYELALSLKELGFNEKCLKSYNKITYKLSHLNGPILKAPLWQQAIKFLIPMIDGNSTYRIIMVKKNGNYMLQERKDEFNFVNYSDGSNSDCIEKLIEIVKNEKL